MVGGIEKAEGVVRRSARVGTGPLQVVGAVETARRTGRKTW